MWGRGRRNGKFFEGGRSQILNHFLPFGLDMNYCKGGGGGGGGGGGVSNFQLSSVPIPPITLSNGMALLCWSLTKPLFHKS